MHVDGWDEGKLPRRVTFQWNLKRMGWIHHLRRDLEDKYFGISTSKTNQASKMISFSEGGVLFYGYLLPLKGNMDALKSGSK